MRRFFAIILCLVLTGSALGAIPRRQQRNDGRAALLVAAVVYVVGWRLGIVPYGDGLTPPIPAPEKAPRCCK